MWYSILILFIYLFFANAHTFNRTHSIERTRTCIAQQLVYVCTSFLEEVVPCFSDKNSTFIRTWTTIVQEWRMHGHFRVLCVHTYFNNCFRYKCEIIQCTSTGIIAYNREKENKKCFTVLFFVIDGVITVLICCEKYRLSAP